MPPSTRRDLADELIALTAKLNRLLLRLVGRISPSDQQRMLVLTAVVGGVCGLVAVAFHASISWCTAQLIDRATALSGWARAAAMIACPVLGALVVGVAAARLPNVRGSGVPQVKASYALSGSRQRVRLRDAAAKFALSSVMIGSGASLGREGPTVQICATVASACGRLFALSPSNQRRLMPVGAAAGIAAAFNAPIAAVTFVIEELVGSLDTTVLSGVVVAAALAAVVEHSVLGEHPVFAVPHEYGLTHASSLLVYGALGVAAGLSAFAFSRGLLEARRSFQQMLRVPGALRPAIGGLVTGVLSVLVLSGFQSQGITGGGYDTIGLALGGELAMGAMVALFGAKAIATVFGYASGGVGGIFAPTLFVGSMLGGLFGYLDQWVLSHGDTPVGAFALVGMGAFFAGVIRAPITSVLIIFEMTGSYRLVLPLMIANTTAFIVARRFDHRSIYEALLDQDGIKLPHRPALAMTSMPVTEAMTKKVLALRADATVSEALTIITPTEFASFPILAPDDSLRGVITEGRLRRLAAEGELDVPLGDHAKNREFLHTGQSLRDALSAMNRLGVRQMVVVHETDRRTLAGILSMSDVMRAALLAEAQAEVASTQTPMPPSRSRGG